MADNLLVVIPGMGDGFFEEKKKFLRKNIDIIKKTYSGNIDFLIFNYSDNDFSDFPEVKVVKQKGFINEYLFKYLKPDDIKQYDYIIIMLDDISICENFDVDKIIEIYNHNDLDIISPTLTTDSEFSYSFMLQNKIYGDLLRITNFTEYFLYLMKRDSYTKYWNLLDEKSFWGWGIPHCLHIQGIRLGLLNEFNMKHHYISTNYKPGTPDPNQELNYNVEKFGKINSRKNLKFVDYRNNGDLNDINSDFLKININWDENKIYLYSSIDIPEIIISVNNLKNSDILYQKSFNITPNMNYWVSPNQKLVNYNMFSIQVLDAKTDKILYRKFIDRISMIDSVKKEKYYLNGEPQLIDDNSQKISIVTSFYNESPQYIRRMVNNLLVVIPGMGDGFFEEKKKFLRKNIDIIKKTYSGNIDFLIFNYSDNDFSDFPEVKVVKQKGFINEYLFKYLKPDDIKQYDYIIIMLDDISICENFDVNKIIEIYNHNDLDIISPTLTTDSEFSYSFMLQNKIYGDLLRITNYCEYFLYIMKRDSYAKYWNLLDEKSFWGWGLDLSLYLRDLKLGLLNEFNIKHHYKNKNYKPGTPNPYIELNHNNERFGKVKFKKNLKFVDYRNNGDLNDINSDFLKININWDENKIYLYSSIDIPEIIISVNNLKNSDILYQKSFNIGAYINYWMSPSYKLVNYSMFSIQVLDAKTDKILYRKFIDRISMIDSVKKEKYYLNGEPQLIDDNSQKISIVTSFYNESPQYIRRLYENIIETDVNWEWIVTDDFSENSETKDELLSIVERDDRVKFYEQKNKMELFRNPTLGTSGDFIFHIDGDDSFNPIYLRHCLIWFNRFPEVSCIISGGRWVDENNSIKGYFIDNIFDNHKKEMINENYLGRIWRSSIKYEPETIFSDINNVIRKNDRYITLNSKNFGKTLYLPRIYIRYTLRTNSNSQKERTQSEILKIDKSDLEFNNWFLKNVTEFSSFPYFYTGEDYKMDFMPFLSLPWEKTKKTVGVYGFSELPVKRYLLSDLYPEYTFIFNPSEAEFDDLDLCVVNSYNGEFYNLPRVPCYIFMNRHSVGSTLHDMYRERLGVFNFFVSESFYWASPINN
jgi:protein-tyrosine-phosphatase